MNFAQFVVDGVCPENRFLAEMSKTVPWNLFEKELTKCIIRKTGGRPAYPVLLLFKMHLLQVWFGLSDAGCEFQIQDRLSFRRFLGLGIDEAIPDSTTLENFRHDFEPVAEQVLAKLDDFFKESGLFLKAGNMIDATFIQANSRPHKDPDKNSDLDADHGHKGFGYTTTVNAHVATKLIRKADTQSARAHDNQLKKNYWAMRRQSFESQVHNCTALQTVAEQVQCFNQVRQLELAQNIAREQAALQQKMVTAEETAILLNQMRNSKPKQQSVDCKSNNMGSFTSTQCRLY